jgi:hypothetical protein
MVTGRPFIATNRGAIGLELLILARKLALAVHEEELASEKPHPHRTGFERARCVPRQLDVGEQFDPLAVERDCRCVCRSRERRARSSSLWRWPEAVLLEHDRRRIDDDDAGVAVDDRPSRPDG